MKILQVIGSISDMRGGTSTAVRNLTAALHLHNCETDIATTDDDGPGKSLKVRRGEFAPISGGRVIYFAKQSRFYSTSLPLLRWLLRNCHRYDLIHVHGLFNFAPGAAAFAASMANRPYVLTPHGTLNEWGLQNRRPLLKRLSMQLFESRIIDGASMLHFTSEREQSESLNRCKSTPNTVIHLGLDLATLAPSDAVQCPIGLPSDATARPMVLFLSRIDRIKNLEALLHACRALKTSLPSVLLVIAGSGDPDFVKRLQLLAGQLGIESNVAWLGFVSGSQKQWLLRHCKMSVLPSESENFGLSIVEAMANAMPVILAPGVGIAPLIQRYGAGAVCNPTADALASTMLSWLADEERLAHAGNVGRNLVWDEMSLDAFGRRTVELYTQVLASHGQPREFPARNSLLSPQK
jgi:glycosyltransferase involved in cell wall biosynthesis